ncbi:DUF6119 family protein [Longimicrobium sp.]|uniref:DUF6119 family protein n=1 Tax=Longimicrobium sp. TaxID=2029185 RepID=UPI003B3B7ED8
MKLVFSLFDDTVENFEEVFLEGKLTSIEDPYVQIPLRQENANVQVYLQRNKRGVPAWIAFFDAHCDFRAAFPRAAAEDWDGDFLANQYNSLVVIFRVSHPQLGERFLALTQGMGHLAVDHSRVEDDFGLTVSLNSINPDKVRGVDARDLGTRTQQKRLRTNFEGEVWELDFDPELEVVGGMVGVPSETDFADQISGSESVALFRQIQWHQFEALCSLLLEKYSSREYESRFKFAANKRRLRNKKIISILEDHLRDALRDRRGDRLSMILPMDLAEHVVETELHIPTRGRRVQLAPFGVGTLFNVLDEAQVLDVEPKNLTLYHYDADGALRDRKSLFKHLVFEIRLLDPNGRQRYFVLSDGGWYEVAHGHVAKIRQRIAAIPVLENWAVLPPMNWLPSTSGASATYRREREDEYNARVSTAHGLVLFDKVLFRQNLGGNSRIEVCDLLGPDGRFYCVKKYEGSSDLSHLYAQGLVSAELLVDVPEYRQFVLDKINGVFQPSFTAQTARLAGLKVVYAIACPTDFRIPEDLPFFAQASLASHARKLVRCGFDVELARIVIPDPPQTSSTAPRRRRRTAAA